MTGCPVSWNTTKDALPLSSSTRDAYRQYCWTVESLDDLKLAPFHLLATERGVHVDQDHVWHMSTLARMAEHDSLLMATAHRSRGSDRRSKL